MAVAVYVNVSSALKRLRGNGEVVKHRQEWGLNGALSESGSSQGEGQKGRRDGRGRTGGAGGERNGGVHPVREWNGNGGLTAAVVLPPLRRCQLGYFRPPFGGEKFGAFLPTLASAELPERDGGWVLLSFNWRGCRLVASHQPHNSEGSYVRVGWRALAWASRHTMNISAHGRPCPMGSQVRRYCNGPNGPAPAMADS